MTSTLKRSATTRTLSIPSEKVLAEVTAFPDEVMVEIHTNDGILTVEQARILAERILEAADEALTIDWDMETNPDAPLLVARK